jgi:hypothetical protein
MAANPPTSRVHRLLRRFAVVQALVTVVLTAESVVLFWSGSRSAGALTLGFAASTLWGAWFMRRIGRGAPVACGVRTKRRTALLCALVATWLAWVGTMTALNSGAGGVLITFGPGFICMVILLVASRRFKKHIASI